MTTVSYKTDITRHRRGFRAIRPMRFSVTSCGSRRFRSVRNSNYESAWTWDIFLLSMLNEMVSASY